MNKLGVAPTSKIVASTFCIFLNSKMVPSCTFKWAIFPDKLSLKFSVFKNSALLLNLKTASDTNNTEKTANTTMTNKETFLVNFILKPPFH